MEIVNSVFDLASLKAVLFENVAGFLVAALVAWVAGVYTRFTGRQLSDANRAKLQAALERFAEIAVNSNGDMRALRKEGLDWLKAQYGETLAAEKKRGGMSDTVLENAVESLVKVARKRAGLS